MTSSTISTQTCALIIPLYNKQNQIRRALDSVKSQKIPFSEVIVVNDCSTDQSSAVVEKFMSEYPQTKVRLIHHKHNSGPGAARNTGIMASQSDYICFLDADDFLTPSATESIHRLLNQSTNSTDLIIFCAQEQVSGAVRPSFQHLQKSNYTQTINKDLLKLNDWASAMVFEPLFCSGGNVLLSRRMTNKYYFDPILRNFEDWDFYFRVCEGAHQSNGDILVSNSVGVIYTEEDENSLSRTHFITQAMRNPPPLIANVDLPLKVRQFTSGVWLCHVTQRSGWFDGLVLMAKAMIQTGNARPPLKYFLVSGLALLVGRNCWKNISRIRKRLRYV